MHRLANTLGSALALVAAIFWFLSAYGDVPPIITYWGGAPPNDPFFYVAMKFSASMNNWAAIFSGMSAACMGLSGFTRQGYRGA
jgi:hypothetical protein